MKARSFHNISSIFILASLLATLVGGLPLQAAGASAAPAPQQTSYDCSVIAQITLTECQALVALYNATAGSSWTIRTGWLSTLTPCSWYGVTCSAGNSHVTQLNIGGNNLVGSLPTELGNLTALTRLDLDSNQLSGAIPTALGSLTQLTYLDLSYNLLTGSVPTEIGSLTQLLNLYLGANLLKGLLPDSLSALTSLGGFSFDCDLTTNKAEVITLLDLISPGWSTSCHVISGNAGADAVTLTYTDNLVRTVTAATGGAYSINVPDGWTGTVTPSLIGTIFTPASKNFTNVTSNKTQNFTAALLGCSHQSQIPQAECDALVALYGSANGAGWTNNTGWGVNNTPCSWYGVTCASSHVSTLYLNNNHLTGSLPSTLGSLAALTILDLDTNQLTGSIPSLSGMTALTNLDLDTNQLTGGIPSLSGLTSLTGLYLYNNQLSGSIPALDAALTDINLGNNQLSGSIPSSLSGLTNLNNLDLHGNQLSGAIPGTLGNLANLATLYLDNNQLSGDIPVELGSLANLGYLTLTYNQLTGTIPSGFSGLHQLVVLNLQFNNMGGNLPATLIGANLPALTYLRFDCGLTSSDSSVNAFVLSVYPGWTSACRTISGNASIDGVKLSYGYSVPAISGAPYTFSITTISAVDGSYTLSVPSNRGGTVTPSKTHFGFTPATRSYTAGSSNLSGENYVAALVTLSISGNAGTGNATISFTGGTPITSAADGSYTITVPYGWAGTVTPSKNGYTFNPASRDYSSAPGPVLSDLAGQNYAATATNVSVTVTSTAAQDGWILESARTSSKGGSMNATAKTINLGDDTAKKQYLGILSFNTGSPLPDNAVVTSVILTFKKQAVVGGGNPVSIFKGFMADIKDGTFNAPTLETKDFQAAASGSYGPFITAPSASGVYTIDLSAGSAFINDLGLTQIRLRFKLGDNNNAIANTLAIFSGNAPAGSQPQLIITYHLP
jgi:Leucine-rich repeat (LRR) protein